jgi:hypothetical protein
MALAAGCGSAKAVGKATPTTTSTLPPASSSTTSTTTPQQAVIADWITAHNALDQASVALDPNFPALAQTTVNPELGQVRLLLGVERQQHDTVRGTDGLGHPNGQVLQRLPGGSGVVPR